jgi:hypothetical protein
LFIRMLCDFFKPRPRLEAEILILRHQLNVLQLRMPRRRLNLRWIDRALFIWLYRRYPRILDAMSIVRPETVVRWHRKGLAHYWRWTHLTKAVLSGAKVIERVLVDNLTETAAYKLEYDKLREYVFAGKSDQLWNVIPASIQTPPGLQGFTERLQRNLNSRDRWIR